MEEKRTDAMLLAHLSTFASFKTLSIKSSILNAGHLFLHSCVWTPHLQWKNEPQSYPPHPIFFVLCGTRHECLGLSREPCILKIKGVGGDCPEWMRAWGVWLWQQGSLPTPQKWPQSYTCPGFKNGRLISGLWRLCCGADARDPALCLALFRRFSFADSLTLSIVRANPILMKSE